LTFLAYERIFTDAAFWRTFLFSLQMAFFTIVVSILLVVPTAYWIR
jgi:putative spermidine/putrescine transport system permease protein